MRHPITSARPPPLLLPKYTILESTADREPGTVAQHVSVGASVGGTALTPTSSPVGLGHLSVSTQCLSWEMCVRVMRDTYVHGDLDQGSNIAAKEGDGDEGVFVSWLLQVKLHEAVMHWKTKAEQTPGPEVSGVKRTQSPKGPQGRSLRPAS